MTRKEILKKIREDKPKMLEGASLDYYKFRAIEAIADNNEWLAIQLLIQRIREKTNDM